MMAEAWTLLDAGCTDETRAWVCQHLGACEGCFFPITHSKGGSRT